jgi:hypothetical protein
MLKRENSGHENPLREGYPGHSVGDVVDGGSLSGGLAQGLSPGALSVSKQAAPPDLPPQERDRNQPISLQFCYNRLPTVAFALLFRGFSPIDHRCNGKDRRLEVPALLRRFDRLRRLSHGLVNSLQFSCPLPPYTAEPI